MNFGIERLPTEVVHLIAAGEVIDSYAAVVRELAENALDAGATRITISLCPEHWRVRVADNGSGMKFPDLQRAAIAHATSKIRDRQDLWKIASLGFRGEALHSLAQLSQLQIASRPAQPPGKLLPSHQADPSAAAEGWQITYDPQGAPMLIEPAAIAPGTIVTADQLFARVPARRQGFPSLSLQLRAVQATIHQLALCHPHVTWQVNQSNTQHGVLHEQPWFSLFAGPTARQILPQILRDVRESDLQELEIGPQEQGVNGKNQALYLLLGLPDRCHRYRPDWVRVAVNGRLVQIPELEQTILGAFRRTLPRDRFPVCFVHLRVPPDQIDWNRHPAKSEIYLHHLVDWQEQMHGAIDQLLRLNSTNLPDSFHSARMQTLLKTAEVAGNYGLEGQTPAYPPSTLSPGSEAIDPGEDTSQLDIPGQGEKSAAPIPMAGLERAGPSSGTIHLKAIAQVHDMYILAEHPGGIWLVEQHIAHERVLYERLCDRWQTVPLRSPLILNQLSPSQVEQLQRIGVEVEPFGEQTWVVRSAPEPLADRGDCSEALGELSLGGDLHTAQVATACRTAIRNGTPLSLPAMQSLLDQWQQTRHPRTCPHGRPICLTLEESSLSRFFRRHWMIGKSHGI